MGQNIKNVERNRPGSGASLVGEAQPKRMARAEELAIEINRHGLR
jgi:hypothetical protein